MTLTPIIKQGYPHSAARLDGEVYDIALRTAGLPVDGVDLSSIIKEGGFILVQTWADGYEHDVRLDRPLLTDGGVYGGAHFTNQIVEVPGDGFWIVTENHTADDPSKRKQFMPETTAKGVQWSEYDFPEVDYDEWTSFEEYAHHFRMAGSSPATPASIVLYDDVDWPVGNVLYFRSNNPIGVDVFTYFPDDVTINVPDGTAAFADGEGAQIAIQLVSTAGDVWVYDVWGDLRLYGPDDPVLSADFVASEWTLAGKPTTAEHVHDTAYWLNYGPGPGNVSLGAAVFKTVGTSPLRVAETWVNDWKGRAEGLVIAGEVDMGVAPGGTHTLAVLFESTSLFFAGNYVKMAYDASVGEISVWGYDGDTVSAAQIVIDVGSTTRFAFALELTQAPADVFTASLSINGAVPVTAALSTQSVDLWAALGPRLCIGGWWAAGSTLSHSIAVRSFGLYNEGRDLQALSGSPAPLPTPGPVDPAAEVRLILPLDGDLTLTSDKGGTSAALPVGGTFTATAQPTGDAESLQLATADTVEVTLGGTADDWMPHTGTYQIELFVNLTGGEVGTLFDFIGSNAFRATVAADDTILLSSLGTDGPFVAAPFTPGVWQHVIFVRTKSSGAGTQADERTLLIIEGRTYTLHQNYSEDLAFTSTPNSLRLMEGLSGQLGAVRYIWGHPSDPWPAGHQARTVPF